MPITPEDKACAKIDKLLSDAGWIVQGRKDTNLGASQGVAVGEFSLKSGHCEAEYLLFVDPMAVGVVEAKKEGKNLARVKLQNQKYSEQHSYVCRTDAESEIIAAPRKPNCRSASAKLRAFPLLNVTLLGQRARC